MYGDQVRDSIGGEALFLNIGGDNGGDNDDVVLMRSVDEFDTILLVAFPVDNKHLLELESDLDMDLSNVDQYSTKVFQKKIMDLLWGGRWRRTWQYRAHMTATHGTL